MRLTLSVIAVAVALLWTAPRAEARARTAADDAKLEKLLGHADKISGILERDLERPKKALKGLDKYLKKHRKKMKALIGQIVRIAGELDDEARADYAQALMTDERTARLLQALGTFKDKHEGDPAHAPKIEALMKELMSEGGRLYDALSG